MRALDGARILFVSRSHQHAPTPNVLNTGVSPHCRRTEYLELFCDLLPADRLVAGYRL